MEISPVMEQLLITNVSHRRSSSDASMSMANMTYATSSPAATTAGQGNGPVSIVVKLLSGLSLKSYQKSWHHSNRAPAFSHFLIDSNLSQSYHLSHLCSSLPLIFTHNGDNFG
jgi:hypothetical protein